MEEATQNTGEHDPVCGRKLDVTTTGHAYRHEGRFHYFCSSGCLKRFIADPQRFLGDADAPEDAPAD